MYRRRILLANCSKSRKSCCLIWLTFVPGVRINLSPLASKFIWLSVNCLFERFLICFLSASNCALFLLVHLFLCLCLRILLDILFPFSLGLRLRYSGKSQCTFQYVYLSFLAILQTFHCTGRAFPLSYWLSYSVQLLYQTFGWTLSVRLFCF